MSLHLPHSAVLAWWLTAWLRGHEVTDHALAAISGDDLLHQVSTGSLLDLFSLARSAGATQAGLALPVDGDPLGLGGPRPFNEAALMAGEAVVVVEASLGLVPEVSTDVVDWSMHEASRRVVPDVGEADRALRAAMTEAATTLASLDVARWRPEIADELLNLRHRPSVDAPAGTPPRCVELAERSLQALGICGLAAEDDGGAISAWEIDQRRGALQPLERAGRRALVAACSPEVWPPHPSASAKD